MKGRVIGRRLIQVRLESQNGKSKKTVGKSPAASWSREKVRNSDWLPADKLILDKIEETL